MKHLSHLLLFLAEVHYNLFIYLIIGRYFVSAAS